MILEESGINRKNEASFLFIILHYYHLATLAGTSTPIHDCKLCNARKKMTALLNIDINKDFLEQSNKEGSRRWDGNA